MGIVFSSGSVTILRWALASSIFLLLVYQERHRARWLPLGQELTIAVSACFLYFGGVNGITTDSLDVLRAIQMDREAAGVER